eukprot:3873287-Pleurochrysis_carterae.AAC.1
MKGTCQPSHFHVVYDDLKLGPDEVQASLAGRDRGASVAQWRCWWFPRREQRDACCQQRLADCELGLRG